MIGYKAFNQGLINRYGFKFNIGKTYSIANDNDIVFGINGNGYHMCTCLADVFRYVPYSFNIDVALVKGDGKYCQYNDEYYGYYDMYAFEKITILKILKRKEILNIILNSNEDAVMKFIVTCPLKLEEIKVIINHFKNCINILDNLLYYQLGYKNIYQENYENQEYLRKELVINYG